MGGSSEILAQISEPMTRVPRVLLHGLLEARNDIVHSDGWAACRY